jgi:hypothetical protein
MTPTKKRLVKDAERHKSPVAVDDGLQIGGPEPFKHFEIAEAARQRLEDLARQFTKLGEALAERSSPWTLRELRELARKVAIADAIYIQSLAVDVKELVTKFSKELALLLREHPEHIPIARKELKKTFAKAETVSQRASWSNVTARNGRNPAEFVRDVYQAELASQQLTRGEIRRLDRPLYQAFATQLNRASIDDIPKEVRYLVSAETPSQRLDRELKEIGIKEPADAYRKVKGNRREADRLYQAALQRTGLKRH